MISQTLSSNQAILQESFTSLPPRVSQTTISQTSSLQNQATLQFIEKNTLISLQLTQKHCNY